MGQAELSKTDRKNVRRVMGDQTTQMAAASFLVLFGRTFWGRLKWLILGK